PRDLRRGGRQPTVGDRRAGRERRRRPHGRAVSDPGRLVRERHDRGDPMSPRPSSTSVLVTGASLLGEDVRDVLVLDGVIAAIADAGTLAADPRAAGVRHVDGTGLVLLPGLVDLHTHLRE